MKNWHKIALILVVLIIGAFVLIRGMGGQPDLVIEHYTVTYDDCPWDGPGAVSVRVKNVGESDAGQFATEINGDDSAIISQLDAGDETDATIIFSAGPVGGVNAEADVQQQISESNEDNNSYQIVFTPPPPCTTPTP